jgi:class 3 adenylate cyclase
VPELPDTHQPGCTILQEVSLAGCVQVSASPAASKIRVGSETAATQTIEGERKTITALFADIRGFTELTRDLDPEEARAIVDPALKLTIDAVHRYDGYVAQSTGDRIFALLNLM